MTIGIDLSSLQGPHRMRGIGYTLLNFVNNISEEDRKKHKFIFFAYPTASNQSPLDLLNLQGIDFEVRDLKPKQRVNKKLPGRLNLLVSVLNQLIELKDLYLGDSRIKTLKNVDFFLQTDQSQHLPRNKWGMKTGLIIYDIIPYVLEWEYLWSYRTARRHGFSRKAALRVYARRWLYVHKIRINSRRADKLFSISEHTKSDFVKHLGIKANKIAVTPLGINLPSTDSQDNLGLQEYVKTSWGYLKKPVDIDPESPFILYVGGADKRRKLEDLVAAFNLLRAQGHKFKLILAGDSMKGPDNIATEEIQYALKASSYLDDIIFMGFVDDVTRDWLYKHANAFVFPSRYEGFGLPVLEAMSYGTPVISYDKTATHEVAGGRPSYVANLFELAESILEHLELEDEALEKSRSQNIAQAKKWSWRTTSKQILDIISSSR